MNETSLSRLIVMEISRLSKGKITLWRNNVGQAVYGKRRVPYGLCVGSSDYIGLRQVTITPDMVGQTIAQFTAVEIKVLTGEERKEQKIFRRHVEECGGLALVCRSVEEVEGALSSNQ